VQDMANKTKFERLKRLMVADLDCHETVCSYSSRWRLFFFFSFLFFRCVAAGVWRHTVAGAMSLLQAVVNDRSGVCWWLCRWPGDHVLRI